MPDTYKTFLSPGSCQLEVTDLVAAANDDKGVDLYGVAWEIEQVLIAGEGFAASPTDVWVNERGILNVGKSLFDKINRTAEDNDNIPGQCTVVVKATSLVDSSKVARLKVLVGYPGEGGGGGGGTDVEFVAMIFENDVPVAWTGSLVVDGSPIEVTTKKYFEGEPQEIEVAVATVPAGSLVSYSELINENSTFDIYESEAAFLAQDERIASFATTTVAVIAVDVFTVFIIDITK